MSDSLFVCLPAVPLAELRQPEKFTSDRQSTRNVRNDAIGPKTTFPPILRHPHPRIGEMCKANDQHPPPLPLYRGNV